MKINKTLLVSCLILLAAIPVVKLSLKTEITEIQQLQRQAEQGDPLAQTNLGAMYMNGEGVTQDDKEAVKWFQLAATQGYADAQNYLGYLYTNGYGVTQDDYEAVKW